MQVGRDREARGEEAVRCQVAHAPEAGRVLIHAGDVEGVEQVAAADVGAQGLRRDQAVVAVVQQNCGVVEAEKVGAAHVEADIAVQQCAEALPQIPGTHGGDDAGHFACFLVVHA
ncbi:hypothetical protein D3C81_1941410 [compost metagenome]